MLLLVRKSTELKSFCFGIRAKPSASAKSQQTTVAGDDIDTERAAVLSKKSTILFRVQSFEAVRCELELNFYHLPSDPLARSFRLIQGEYC